MSLPKPDFSSENVLPGKHSFPYKFTISPRSSSYSALIEKMIDGSFLVADDKKGFVALYYVAKIQKDIITFKLREAGLRRNRELYLLNAKLSRDFAKDHGYIGPIKKLK